MKLAERIRNIREAHLLSQAEVADKCEMSPQAYSKIERLAGNSSFNTLSKIADAIGVSVSFLVDIHNPNFE
jgi:transcriptional regulator with XRE-family HTH domain